MAKDGVRVHIYGDYDDKDIRRLQKDLESLKSNTQSVSDKFKSFGSSLSSFGKTMTTHVTLPLVAVGAGLFAATQKASDLAETTSKVGVVFGKQATIIQDFSKTASKSLGLSQQAAMDAAATFAIFGKGAGLSGNNLTDFSTKLVSLSSDMASFSNTTPEEAILAIGSALRGEMEPIRKYGVLLNDDALKQEALRMGIYNGTGALTAQQKVLAAQAAIFKQTGDAQGDFARTSTGAANQQRILKAELENLTTEVGSALLPVLTDLMNMFKSNILPILQGAVKSFKGLDDGTRRIILTVGAVVAAFGPFLFIVGKTVNAMTSLSGVVVSAAGNLKNFALGFSNAGAVISKTDGKMMRFGATVKNGISSLASFTTQLAKNGATAAVSAGKFVAATAVKIAHAVATGAVTVATIAQTAATWALTAAVAALTSPITLIVAAIALFVGALILAYNKIDWFRNFVDTAFKAVLTAISFVFNWVKDNWPTLLAILTGPIGIAVKLISTHWDTIKNVAEIVFNAVKDTIGSFVDTMKELPGMIGSIIGNVVNFYTELPGKILNVFKNAGSWLFNVGKDIIQGLLNGAGSLLKTIGSFFLDKLPGWIVGPFKMALGIDSPSKMFIGFGENIGQGLINGINSKKESVAKASKDMAQAVIEASKKKLGEWDAELDKRFTYLEEQIKRADDWSSNMRSSLLSAFDIGSSYEGALDKEGKLNASKWMEGVNAQIAKTEWFGNVLKAIQANGGPNAQALVDYLASKGAEQGGAMGQAMINEGLIVEMANKMALVQTEADKVAKSMVPPFLTQGVAMAQSSYDGFKKNFGEGGPARIAIEKLMDRLAASLDRTATITVTTVNRIVNEAVKNNTTTLPQRAKGGPVSSNTAYLVGENGPEVFVPSASGQIVPNIGAASTMSGMSSGSSNNSAGNSYSINVNTGVGDPRRIGEEIVSLITRFEKANGPVYAKAV